jgi:hypothetical protein
LAVVALALAVVALAVAVVALAVEALLPMLVVVFVYFVSWVEERMLKMEEEGRAMSVRRQLRLITG